MEGTKISNIRHPLWQSTLLLQKINEKFAGANGTTVEWQVKLDKSLYHITARFLDGFKEADKRLLLVIKQSVA